MISSRFRLIADTISVLVINEYLVPIFILNIEDEITLWYFNWKRSTRESQLCRNVILRDNEAPHQLHSQYNRSRLRESTIPLETYL